MIKDSINKSLVWIFLFFMSLNFFLSGLSISKKELPKYGDEPEYLESAINVKNGRGFVFYGKDFFRAEKGLGYHPESNRHPLYILLLSIFAQEDESFRLKARVFTLAIGLIFLWIFFLIGRNTFDVPIVLGALFFLSINSAFVVHSVYAGCEPLLILLTFIAWYYSIKGFKDRKYWPLAGAFAGLAYLTKGSGTLIIMAFCLSSVIIYRWRVFKDKNFYLYLLAFLVVSSPLLMRNIAQFNDPFYNINTKYCFWDSSHTALEYLKIHTPTEILNQMLNGTIRFGLYFLKYFSKPFGSPLSHTYIWSLISSFFIIFFLLSITGNNDREGKIFTFSLFTIFYILFSWYCRGSIEYSMRFVLPVVPVVYLYSIKGIKSLIREGYIYKNLTVDNLFILLLTICLALRLLWFFQGSLVFPVLDPNR